MTLFLDLVLSHIVPAARATEPPTTRDTGMLGIHSTLVNVRLADA